MSRNEKRSFHYYRLLGRIWRRPGVSRAELAREFELDRSTVTLLVGDMIERGRVSERATPADSRPQAGRRPVGLEIRSGLGVIGGIDVRPDCAFLVLTDLSGGVVWQSRSAVCTSRESFFGNVSGMFGDLKRAARRLGPPILGLGLGISGIVDTGGGRIVHSIPLACPDGLEVGGGLEYELGVPVVVENDANCGAWGMLVRRRGEGVQNFLYGLLNLRVQDSIPRDWQSAGLGLGMVINGRLHHGTGFSVGEFRSLFHAGSARGQFSLDERDLLKVREDAGLREKFVCELVRHLAFLVNTLNFSHVFLGGDVVGLRGALQDAFLPALTANWVYDTEVDCQLAFDTAGEFAVAGGAACTLLESLFSAAEKPEDLVRKERLWGDVSRTVARVDAATYRSGI